MPTVLRAQGFRVVIIPGDHPPAHVYVFKAGGEVKVEIGQGAATRAFRAIRMNRRDVAAARALVAAYEAALVSVWRAINGNLR
jgi:hypothetical protein